MFKRLSNLFDISGITDPDDARKRRLLNIFLVALTTLLFISIIATVISYIPSGPYSIYAIIVSNINLKLFVEAVVACLVVFPALFFMNRSSSVPGWLTRTIFLLLLLGIIGISDTPKNLVSSLDAITFVIPVFMAAFLLRPTASFIIAIVAIIEVQYLSYLTNVPGSFPETFLSPVLLGIAVIAWVAGQNIERYISETRKLAGQRQAILQGITDGIIVFDPAGELIVFNPAAEKMLAINLQGLSIDELAAQAPSSELGGLIKDVATFQKKEVKVDWNKLTLTLTASLVNDEIGRLIGHAVVIHDVTKEAQIERIKDAIISLTSHELRTPVTIIKSHAEMIEFHLDHGQLEKAKASVVSILNGIDRLTSTFSSMNTLADIQAGKIVIKRQPTVIEDVTKILEPFQKKASAKGLVYSLVIEHPFGIINMDVACVKVILHNLVSNAIKFTDKGSITVKVKQPEKDYWTIEVEDTGRGIQKDQLPNLFDAFMLAGNSVVTRGYQGIGLGLSVTKQLVGLLDGVILVETQAGKGSVFTVRLPTVDGKNVN